MVLFYPSNLFICTILVCGKYHIQHVNILLYLGYLCVCNKFTILCLPSIDSEGGDAFSADVCFFSTDLTGLVDMDSSSSSLSNPASGSSSLNSETQANNNLGFSVLTHYM